METLSLNNFIIDPKNSAAQQEVRQLKETLSGEGFFLLLGGEIVQASAYWVNKVHTFIDGRYRSILTLKNSERYRENENH